jgi:hypothetical protein
MVEIQWHSQTKERATANTNFNLHRRASPRPYLGGGGGAIPLLYSTGSGRVIIRRSKADQAGKGSLAYLSPDTVAYLKTWLRASGITKGAGFRRLIGRGRIGERLQVDAIAQTFKRVAEFVGMPAKDMRQVSGHSIRVGATQDMLELNIDLASVMQAGRWKTTAMPMRYGENIQAGLGGMARTAQSQGRAK